jgi:hypothetical protein
VSRYILVDTVHASPGTTVWTAEGEDSETGERVVFGGDWRQMSGLLDAVENEGEVVAYVEDWQILGRVVA